MTIKDRPTAGCLIDGTHHLPICVYFEDTDAGGVAYHATYLGYFERARWEMLVLSGIDLLAALQDGTGTYVVTEAHLKYRQPARLGDQLTIVSVLEALGASTCVVQQKVMRDGQLLVEGRIRLAFVGPNGKPRRQPTAWIKAFETFMGATKAE